jgi:hypothetical protein
VFDLDTLSACLFRAMLHYPARVRIRVPVFSTDAFMGQDRASPVPCCSHATFFIDDHVRRSTNRIVSIYNDLAMPHCV